MLNRHALSESHSSSGGDVQTALRYPRSWRRLMMPIWLRPIAVAYFQVMKFGFAFRVLHKLSLSIVSGRPEYWQSSNKMSTGLKCWYHGNAESLNDSGWRPPSMQHRYSLQRSLQKGLAGTCTRRTGRSRVWLIEDIVALTLTLARSLIRPAGRTYKVSPVLLANLLLLFIWSNLFWYWR